MWTEKIWNLTVNLLKNTMRNLDETHMNGKKYNDEPK